MRLRTASTFLFVGAISALLSELLRNALLYSTFGFTSYVFTFHGVLVTLSEIVYALLFLLIAVSYKGIRYNPKRRKLLGLFLAISCGMNGLLLAYTMYTFLGKDSGTLTLFVSAIHLLTPIPLMVVGIALYLENRRFLRGAMIAGMIGFLLLLAVLTYYMMQYYVDSDFFQGGIWEWLNYAAMLEVVLPVAQFFWALAVYKQTQPDKMNDNTSVIDQL